MGLFVGLGLVLFLLIFFSFRLLAGLFASVVAVHLRFQSGLPLLLSLGSVLFRLDGCRLGRLLLGLVGQPIRLRLCVPVDVLLVVFHLFSMLGLLALVCGRQNFGRVASVGGGRHGGDEGQGEGGDFEELHLCVASVTDRCVSRAKVWLIIRKLREGGTVFRALPGTFFKCE